MYPNLTLKIENYIPKLIFSKDKSTSREIFKTQKSIEALMEELIKKLNLTVEEGNDESAFICISHLASHGDETFAGVFPTLVKESTDFNLEKKLNEYTDQLIKESDKFESYGELDKEVKNELVRNQNLDILAASIDYIYYLLIAKALLTAADLGLGKIYLDDATHNLRLQAKMSTELANLELAFEII